MIDSSARNPWNDRAASGAPSPYRPGSAVMPANTLQEPLAVALVQKRGLDALGPAAPAGERLGLGVKSLRTQEHPTGGPAAGVGDAQGPVKVGVLIGGGGDHLLQPVTAKGVDLARPGGADGLDQGGLARAVVTEQDRRAASIRPCCQTWRTIGRV